MKTHKYFGVIVILTMLFVLLPAGLASAGTTKVAVCHLNDTGGFNLITISEMAFPSHLEHGDASPGDWVPGQPGKKFADDCSLISIPQKEIIQTLTVYATLSGGQKQVAYSMPLTLGQLYELRAIGKYKFAIWATSSLPDAGYADAKYSYRIGTTPPGLVGWIDGASLWPDPAMCYGLQVTLYDGDTDKPLTPVGWIEPFNAAHIYTAPYTGTGSAIGLFIWDDQYSDNVGSITVEIWKINW